MNGSTRAGGRSPSPCTTPRGCSEPIRTCAPASSARPAPNGPCCRASSAAKVQAKRACRSARIAPITLARLIDKLDAAGLVERRADPADRRAHRLFLTSKAIPTLRALGELGEDVMGRALAGLDDATVEAILKGLTTIKANLKSELHSGTCTSDAKHIGDPRNRFRGLLRPHRADGPVHSGPHAGAAAGAAPRPRRRRRRSRRWWSSRSGRVRGASS